MPSELLLEDNHQECCRCEERFSDEELYNHNGELYCCDCEGKHFIVCARCSDSADIDNAVQPDEDWYCCENCANRAGWYRCEDCDDWINTNRDSVYNHPSEGVLCEDCFNDNYHICNGCDEVYHNDDLQYNDNDDEGGYYCEDCSNPHHRLKNNELIRDYSYKPREYQYSRMAWENTVYLGIELEVECPEGTKPQDKAKLVVDWLSSHNVGERVYIKDDGSLRNGFEIVFMPATLQAIHKKFPMRSFLRYLQDIKLTSHESGRCGLHVHVSKKRLTDRDLYKGKMFFYKCQHWLIKFSCRKSDGLNFCKFAEQEPALLDCSQEAGRYSAFNPYASSQTCELRLFRGTLIYDRFLASLQFSDAFIEYIQKIGVAYTKTTPKVKMWHDFIDYAKRSGKYKQFTNYVLQKGLV